MWEYMYTKNIKKNLRVTQSIWVYLPVWYCICVGQNRATSRNFPRGPFRENIIRSSFRHRYKPFCFDGILLSSNIAFWIRYSCNAYENSCMNACINLYIREVVMNIQTSNGLSALPIEARWIFWGAYTRFHIVRKYGCVLHHFSIRARTIQRYE